MNVIVTGSIPTSTLAEASAVQLNGRAEERCRANAGRQTSRSKVAVILLTSQCAFFWNDDGAGTETSMRCPLFWRQRLGVAETGLNIAIVIATHVLITRFDTRCDTRFTTRFIFFGWEV